MLVAEAVFRSIWTLYNDKGTMWLSVDSAALFELYMTCAFPRLEIDADEAWMKHIPMCAVV